MIGIFTQRRITRNLQYVCAIVATSFLQLVYFYDKKRVDLHNGKILYCLYIYNVYLRLVNLFGSISSRLPANEKSNSKVPKLFYLSNLYHSVFWKITIAFAMSPLGDNGILSCINCKVGKPQTNSRLK